MSHSNSETRIGLVGTGFIARGVSVIAQRQGYSIGPALTRRDPAEIRDWPLDSPITTSVDELIEGSDIILECCGDPIHATVAVEQALAAGKPVITMDAEFHITTGSYFVGKGILTEAEGDQPGCIAALRREALDMGFEPLVYGNVKGFLNHNPTREDMEYWSAKNGISLVQTTSFTDGTKLQIEQALVANAFGAGIHKRGLVGAKAENPENQGMLEQIDSAANFLADVADKQGCAISDYAHVGGCPAVFVTAKHEQFHRPYLSYMKMGDGPYFTLVKNYHLCHLEVMKTIKDIVRLGQDGVLMDNSPTPRISVVPIAKCALKKGDSIKHGVGSFEFRGEAIETATMPDHVPIGLLQNAHLTRDIEPGELLSMADVDLPQSRALEIWNELAAKYKTPGAFSAA